MKSWLIILGAGILAQNLAFAVPYAYDKVVYGEDNRHEVFDSPSPELSKYARSTAAMISTSRVKSSSPWVFSGKSLKDTMMVCADEPFANEPVIADCTGFLVGPDLMLTAGHCIRDQKDCDSVVWAFDFKMNSQEAYSTQFPDENVYKCKEIVSRALNTNTTKEDFALIRLDRTVVNRTPLKYRTSGSIQAGDEIAVIGHPTGLPMKIADGAFVRDSSSPVYFVANLDTFQGNSGSPVFNIRTGEVEGILVRGENDYNYDYKRRCYVTNRCDADKCRGEDVTKISIIKELNK